MACDPSANGTNGRLPNGRFMKGNAGGPGNPHSQRVAELRNALLAAVTADDVEKIITALIKAAKAGDTVAAREVLDRTIGKPSQTDVLQRLAAVEHALNERKLI